MANILVYIELINDSASWASLLALRQARFLATNVGATIYAVLPCATPPMYGENDIIAILSRQGADKVILMTHGDLTPPMLFQSHGEALLTAASQFPPALMLLPEGPAAVEIGPRVAARLGGLFVRHPRLSVQMGSSIRIDQPVYENTHVRRFFSAELEHSVVAVVSPDPQQFARALGTEEAEVVVISPNFGDGSAAPRPTLVVGQPASCQPQRMVLVGAGITEAAEVDALRELADLLKADLRVTQSALDKGLLEAPILEESPLVCCPDLVLAFGVHGSPETLACLSNVTYLVGVNPDENAPLFKRAQLGLVAPALEAARQMVTEAKAHRDEPLLPVPKELPEEPEPQETDEGPDEENDSSLIDTVLPRKTLKDARMTADTAEMEPVPKEPMTDGEPNAKTAVPTQTKAPEAGTQDVESTPQASKIDPDAAKTGVAATIRPIDQLAHTPPMGTPMTVDLQDALAAASAPKALRLGNHTSGVHPAGTQSTPVPSDTASDNTPEAAPAGVATDAEDMALDDTMPAPLPGADVKPAKVTGSTDTPTTKPQKGEQEP